MRAIRGFPKVMLLGFFALSFLVLLAGPQASHAVSLPPGGQVNFFATQAEGGGVGCLVGTVWPTYGNDGNVGFYSNLPGGSSDAQVVPTVGTGSQSICIELILNGQTPYTYYTISISGPTITSSNTGDCRTDPYGNADCVNVFFLTVEDGCATNTINISPAVSGVQGTNGNEIHGIANLLYNNGTCSTTTVPEFPLGVFALLAAALPAVLVLRAKYSAKLNHVS